MTEMLFRHSLYGAIQNVQQKAAKEVHGLDRGLFSDPAALGERLDQIKKRYELDVARINADGVEAKAREEEYRVNDYGHQYTSKRTWLDVTIPYSGDSESFQLQPSHSAMIMERITVEKNSLTLTIMDDQNAENNVKTALAQITRNLDTIRVEYERFKPEVEKAIQQAAEERKTQIASENERDKGRSFKVKR